MSKDEDNEENRSIISSQKKSKRKESSKFMHKEQPKVNKYLLGKIAMYPTIDISGEFMVSVSENGKGFLNEIKYISNKNNKGGYLNVQEFNNNDAGVHNPISFEEIKKFKISEDVYDSTNPVIMVQIQYDHDIFIVGQMRGTVSILNLRTCDQLGVFNKGIVNLPPELIE